MAVALPTLFVAFWITWHSRKVLSDCVHNGAVCFWVCANITWMIGEFFFADRSRPPARMFFFGGMGLLILYYLYEAALKIKNRNSTMTLGLHPSAE